MHESGKVKASGPFSQNYKAKLTSVPESHPWL